MFALVDSLGKADCQNPLVSGKILQIECLTQKKGDHPRIAILMFDASDLYNVSCILALHNQKYLETIIINDEDPKIQK